MKKFDPNKKRVARYCLLLETSNGTYNYDFDLGTFVRLCDDETPKRTTIEKIDFLTANYDSQEQFLQCYSINDPVKTLKVSYNLKGERKIAPVFDNKEWAELARTYRGQDVDFRNYNNLYIFEQIYYEIIKLNSHGKSEFGDYLREKCNLSPNTNDVIKLLVAHERAINDRYQNMMGIKDIVTESQIEDIYFDDKDAFKGDLRNRLANYRELRSAYLNLCHRYKSNVIDPAALQKEGNILLHLEEKVGELQSEREEEQKELPTDNVKKLVKEPPQQLSMFDFMR